LRHIHERLVEARRELDALIGDAYLRPRASIVPVHFLDLASAVEKLRWAEKEWRELDRELREAEDEPTRAGLLEAVPAETPPHLNPVDHIQVSVLFSSCWRASSRC
jgi:hypothetical protein